MKFFFIPSKASRILPMLVVMGITVVIFWPTMLHFFAIDDFFWVWYAMHELSHLMPWIQAFTHINGSGQYRPISQQLYFWVGFHLFGLNPLGYHLLNLSVFILSCWLLYRLLLNFVSSPLKAASATTIFCFSSVHFEHLFWISAFTESAATLFVVASLFSTVSGREWIAVIWYVIGLATNETTIILPALVLVLYMVQERLSFIESLKRSWKFWSVFCAYLLLRTTLFGGIGAKGAFAIVWSPQIWIQEIIHSLLDVVDINPAMRNVWASSEVWEIVIIASIFIIASIVTYILISNIKSSRIRGHLVLLGCLWFVISLTPVLPFAHNFANYTISIPAIGLSLVFIGLLEGSDNLILYPLTSFCLLALSLADLYGPGGIYQVDGYRLLANGDHQAYVQMQAIEERIHRPLVVSVIGTEQAYAALGDQWTAMVVFNGSRTVLGPSSNADLVLKFNPSSLSFTVIRSISH